MFSLIAAIGKNRELGKNGELVFRMPEDMKYFRDTTMGYKVLMGRKTWESLPAPLKGRENIVISRNPNGVFFEVRPDTIVSDLSSFIKKYKDSDEEIFVIGGGMVYWEMMKYANKLYLTEIDANVEADTFFPEFDKNEWIRTVIKEGEDNGIKYAFVIYER